MRLLVTSRQEMDGQLGAEQPSSRQPPLITNKALSRLSDVATQQLVKAITGDLISDDEAAVVARASRCVPLLLRLVAGALVAGCVEIKVCQLNSLPPAHLT